MLSAYNVTLSLENTSIVSRTDTSLVLLMPNFSISGFININTAGGNVQSLQVVTVIDQTTISGINAINSSLDSFKTVIVYPNPNSGSFKIAISSAQPTHAELLNSFGQIIRQFELNDKITDISGIQPGFYLLKIGKESRKILVE